MANSFNELSGLGDWGAYAVLVAWWRLDETSGTTASDYSGNGRDATYARDASLTSVSGATAWGGNAFDPALVSDVATLASDAIFNFGTSPSTVVARVFRDSTGFKVPIAKGGNIANNW